MGILTPAQAATTMANTSSQTVRRIIAAEDPAPDSAALRTISCVVAPTPADALEATWAAGRGGCTLRYDRAKGPLRWYIVPAPAPTEESSPCLLPPVTRDEPGMLAAACHPDGAACECVTVRGLYSIHTACELFGARTRARIHVAGTSITVAGRALSLAIERILLFDPDALIEVVPANCTSPVAVCPARWTEADTPDAPRVYPLCWPRWLDQYSADSAGLALLARVLAQTGIHARVTFLLADTESKAVHVCIGTKDSIIALALATVTESCLMAVQQGLPETLFTWHAPPRDDMVEWSLDPVYALLAAACTTPYPADDRPGTRTAFAHAVYTRAAAGL